ncbi:FAD-dependent oxidoreductase [Chloroflexota bacterium]
MTSQLSRLFEPGLIGKMKVKNRIIMAPVSIASLEYDGEPNDRTINYFVERAKGGVGLIILPPACVVHASSAPHRFNLYDDKFIPGLKSLTQAVQANGARVAIQLEHHGIILPSMWYNYPERPEEVEVVGPSAVPCLYFGVTPRELSRDEIHELVEAFGESARRAKDAGFDAVEIHGAHGYFLSAFLSPFKNRRSDEYGGSIKNRARFPCEVIARVRQKVGPDYPVIFRFSGSDFLDGGITLDDTVKQAPMFMAAGADALHVSAGSQETTWWRDLCYLFPDGAIVHLAEAVKRVVNVPVITVGKIGDPVLAERILEEGRADFVAMGRPLMADAQLPNKAKAGKLGDIRRCLNCNNCWQKFGTLELIQASGSGLGCTVNPSLLREKEFEIVRTTSPKKVVVIGGGVGGMEAARVLAERGHQVTLYEQGDKLGGQWLIASQQESKTLYGSFTDYLMKGLARANVKVELGKEVTSEFIRKINPDAVVVATGATPGSLDVPGVESKNVVQAVDVITGKARVGDTVVVIGGRLVGMEVADSLAKLGKKVTLVTKNRLGENGEPLERNIYVPLRDSLIAHGVVIYAHTPVFEIRDNGVYVIDGKELMFMRADSIVLAVGSQPKNKLVEELKSIVPEVHAIGDCVKPRDARQAVSEAAVVARLI